MWEPSEADCRVYDNRVLILVCVEVSVGETKPETKQEEKPVLILVCVEVSVGVIIVGIMKI